MFSVLFGTGLRVNELRCLEWEDVFLSEKTISIRGVKRYSFEGQDLIFNTKGKKSRKVPISETIRPCLVNYEKARGIIFPFLHHSRLNEVLQRCMARIGRPEVTEVHSTRRTFAINCRLAGIPLEVVSDWLGHEDMELTRAIYAKYQPVQGIEEIQKIDKLFDNYDLT
jgi:integrase